MALHLRRPLAGLPVRHGSTVVKIDASLHLSSPSSRSRRHRHARRRHELFVRTDLFRTSLARSLTSHYSISSPSSTWLLDTPHLIFLTPRTTHSASQSPAHRPHPHHSSSSSSSPLTIALNGEPLKISLHIPPVLSAGIHANCPCSQCLCFGEPTRTRQTLLATCVSSPHTAPSAVHLHTQPTRHSRTHNPHSFSYHTAHSAPAQHTSQPQPKPQHQPHHWCPHHIHTHTHTHHYTWIPYSVTDITFLCMSYVFVRISYV